MEYKMFGNLTTLVLVEILAALPMEHVVRMARLGHERLRQACSLKWVTDRMTDVTFGTIVRAHLMGGDVAAAFCTKHLMKRLNGRVTVTGYGWSNAYFGDACVEMAKQVPGKIHLSRKTTECRDSENIDRFHDLVEDITEQMKPSYASEMTDQLSIDYTISDLPTLVFEYVYSSYVEQRCVYYRPALLNGRHIVDVLRAVCGPADVNEAELDRVRREATEKARDVSGLGEKFDGVWSTWWCGAVVTAEALAV